MTAFGPTRVDIGSGYAPADGFDVHTDINPACPHLEHVGPADSFPADWAGRFDEARACDVLEHFSYLDTARVLAEWRRILAPCGRIYIQVPDAALIVRAWFAGSLPRPPEMSDDVHPDAWLSYWLMGGHGDGVRARDGDDWRWNAHYTAFSPGLLRWHMERAGFVVESTEALNLNLACWARRVG